MQFITHILFIGMFLSNVAHASVTQTSRLCEAEMESHNYPVAARSETPRLPKPWLVSAVKKMVGESDVQSLRYRSSLSRIQTYIERHPEALKNLAWDVLIEMASKPLFDLEFRTALREAILVNSAPLEERREVLKRSLSTGQGNLFLFIDEILGISRVALEQQEMQHMNSGNEAGREAHAILGVGSSHDLWFSQYRELLNIADYSHMVGIRRVADLGAGSGRLGLLIGFLYPEIEFIGLEVYSARVIAAKNAAQRWGFDDRIRFVEQDLLDKRKVYPKAQLYFIYGPTNSLAINAQVIERLRVMPGPMQVVSNHLAITVPLIEHDGWLGRARVLVANAATRIFGAEPAVLAKFQANHP